ncbi:transcription factor WRKY45-2-like [Phragmites australis]|uniref:transcription factor WRKY45-2-like n=1 Tax=Phragmites australis TaxID=29695 RepID=UPI002D774B1F|nr:transcription factor WRKY45-2-like [Phragmites australis]
MALSTPAAVVLELMTMGQKSAAHLGDLLRAASPASPQGGEQHQELAAEILRCCGRVIDALRATGARGQKRKAVEYDDVAAGCSPPAMPPKRRARGAVALREVKSGTTVDGFIWRKYGQKEINGRKHPRLYYRCAYRHQGCTATRRVQRSQEEPAAYEIHYYGEHTCRGAAACQGAAPPPAVVDFGSNAWGWGGAPAASEPRWSWDGEMSHSQSQGWSSSASSEVEFEVHTLETARVEEPSATPCYASPVLEFLDGCFDWESVINDPLNFDFGDLHHVATFQ